MKRDEKEFIIKDVPHIEVIKDNKSNVDITDSINKTISSEIVVWNATFTNLDVVKGKDCDLYILHFIRKMTQKELEDYN